MTRIRNRDWFRIRDQWSRGWVELFEAARWGELPPGPMEAFAVSLIQPTVSVVHKYKRPPR